MREDFKNGIGHQRGRRIYGKVRDAQGPEGVWVAAMEHGEIIASAQVDPSTKAFSLSLPTAIYDGVLRRIEVVTQADPSESLGWINFIGSPSLGGGPPDRIGAGEVHTGIGWASAERLDVVAELLFLAFDAEHYASQLRQRGVELSSGELVSHLLAAGDQLAINPTRWFDSQAYLAAHPEALSAGVSSFLHWLACDKKGDGLLTIAEMRWLQDRILIDAVFDRAYYSDRYSVPEQAALADYMESGWRLGRKPYSGYLEPNFRQGLSTESVDAIPLVRHRLEELRAGGTRRLGMRHRALMALEPMKDRLRYWRNGAVPALGCAAGLTRALELSLREKPSLFVGVSHDNYQTTTGGMQLCLRLEAVAMARYPYTRIHLFPGNPSLVVEAAAINAVLGVIVDDELKGFFTAPQVLTALTTATAGGAAKNSRFAIHSLLGHDVDSVIAVLETAGARRGYFWIHDYAAACDGYNLMRNDVEFCGAPPPQSTACMICIYGPLRCAQISAHRRLFETFEIDLISPSAIAAQTWLSAWSHPHNALHIHGHCELQDPWSGASRPAQSGALKVAFLGMPTFAKGWAVFAELAQTHHDDPRYTFLHFGKEPKAGSQVRFEAVGDVGAQEGPMIRALREHEVDLVVLWALCRETFSFTAYEAIAAGALILTGPDSGNVKVLAQDEGFGWALDSEGELAELFASGEVLERVRQRGRPPFRDLVFSGMTADFLPAAA